MIVLVDHFPTHQCPQRASAAGPFTLVQVTRSPRVLATALLSLPASAPCIPPGTLSSSYIELLTFSHWTIPPLCSFPHTHCHPDFSPKSFLFTPQEPLVSSRRLSSSSVLDKCPSTFSYKILFLTMYLPHFF